MGIENLNLLQYKQNSEAAQAFNSYVSSLPSSCAYFRIFVGRKRELGINESNVIDRKEFIEWMANANNSKHFHYKIAFLPIFQCLGSNQDVMTRKLSNEVRPTASSRSSTANNSQDEGPLKLNANGKDVADDAASIASVQQIDPFNRESATRKSFSEKVLTSSNIKMISNIFRVHSKRELIHPNSRTSSK